MITVRTARQEDVSRYYPDMRCSFVAWVCELNGAVVGMIGIAKLRPVAAMFSVFEEVLRPHLKSLTILRLIKRAEAAVKASHVPVLALAQPDEPTAPTILQRLGFTFVGSFDDGDYYGWGLN